MLGSLQTAWLVLSLRVHVSKQLYFGLNVVPIWVLWGPSTYYLGTWTLRVLQDYMLTRN